MAIWPRGGISIIMNDKKVEINGNQNIIADGDIIIKNIQKLPSLLGKALPILVARIDDVEELKNQPSIPYEIEEKIEFNQLFHYRKPIEEYSIYGNIVDQIYENLDKSSPSSKRKIFRYLTSKYINSKIKYSKDTGNYADKIFKNVITQIKKDIEQCELHSISMEELEIGALIIACHGFINCKIMENIPDDSR